MFPDALFIYLYREPRENVSSAIDAWRSGKFVTYPDLPGWDGPPWSLLLIPGWRELNGKPVEEVAAAQWRAANEHILDDLGKLPRNRWLGVSYAELLADPRRGGAGGRIRRVPLGRPARPTAATVAPYPYSARPGQVEAERERTGTRVTRLSRTPTIALAWHRVPTPPSLAASPQCRDSSRKSGSPVRR